MTRSADGRMAGSACRNLDAARLRRLPEAHTLFKGLIERPDATMSVDWICPIAYRKAKRWYAI
jgi:hypothetical protein